MKFIVELSNTGVKHNPLSWAETIQRKLHLSFIIAKVESVKPVDERAVVAERDVLQASIALIEAIDELGDLYRPTSEEAALMNAVTAMMRLGLSF